MVSNVGEYVVLDLVDDVVVNNCGLVVVGSAVLVGGHWVRLSVHHVSDHWGLRLRSRSQGSLLLGCGLLSVQVRHGGGVVNWSVSLRLRLLD